MKKYNFLSIILLGITIVSCGDTKKSNNSIFSFDESKFQAHYLPQDNIKLGVLNPESKEVDSVVYYINDLKIGTTKGLEKLAFDFKTQKLGYQNLKAIVYYNGENALAISRVELVSNVEPKLLKYTILNTYPHDTSSFIEGLEFHKDTLYEGTGNYNESKLLKTDYKTGKIYKNLHLEGKYFGEGITIIKNKIYQITYKEKTGFIYNADTWKLEKTFKYDKEIEGWGMTNDGTYIYQSDGTEKIWRMDPATLKMIDYVNVYSGNAKIESINELEWIDGKIYTNVFTKDAIAVVNSASGAVEGILDMSGLRKFLTHPNAEVLNGIAYNPKTKTIFITGKYWDKMFEIKVSE